jgi:hypothetical protein
MNFQRFGLNLVSNFYLNSVRTQAGHVAASDYLVPFHSDQDFRPSDLKGCGWLRSEHTSLS